MTEKLSKLRSFDKQ